MGFSCCLSGHYYPIILTHLLTADSAQEHTLNSAAVFPFGQSEPFTNWVQSFIFLETELIDDCYTLLQRRKAATHSKKIQTTKRFYMEFSKRNNSEWFSPLSFY